MCSSSERLSCLFKPSKSPRASTAKVDPVATVYRPTTHCIFDLDGLLIDDEGKCAEIISEIVKKFNKTLPRETRYRILGTREERTAELVITELKLPLTIEEFLERYRALCAEKMGDCALMKGAERLIRHLHANNIPIALVTCSSEPLYELKIKKHREIFNLFSHVAFGSSEIEVVKGKLQPNIFLTAAERFQDKPDPEMCLVFEDSPSGTRAAKAAGMQCIMVPVVPVLDYMLVCATIVLKSLEDFKPEDFGLPEYGGHVIWK